MERFNEGIINLAGVDIMSIVIIISLVIHFSSLEKWFDIGAKYEKLMRYSP